MATSPAFNALSTGAMRTIAMETMVDILSLASCQLESMGSDRIYIIEGDSPMLRGESIGAAGSHM